MYVSDATTQTVRSPDEYSTLRPLNGLTVMFRAELVRSEGRAHPLGAGATGAGAAVVGAVTQPVGLALLAVLTANAFLIHFLDCNKKKEQLLDSALDAAA